MPIFDASVIPDYDVIEQGASIPGDPIATGSLGSDDAAFTTPTGTYPGTYGDFEWNQGTGTWTYTLDDTRPATQALTQGQIVHDSFGVDDGVNPTWTVEVTVTGSNDAAVITHSAGDDVAVIEAGGIANGAVGDPTAGGTLQVNDVDSPSAFLPAANLNGVFGTFTFDENTGAWTYALDNDLPATQALRDGEGALDSTVVQSVDGTSFTIFVNITGTNDTPVITGADTGDVTEDVGGPVLTATGSLSINDPDATESSFVAANGVPGTYGSLDVDAAGNWTYTADNSQPAIQQLGANDTLTDNFFVTTADGTFVGVTVTIHGDNDLATIGGTASGDVEEDNVLTATGNLTVTDVDFGEDTVAPVLAGTAGDFGYGTFEVLANGQWTYTLDNTNSDVQALPDGQTLTDTITVLSADGTDSQTITVTITGTNDVATIGGTVSGDVQEDVQLVATGTLNVADVDTGENAVAAVAAGTPGDNNHGTFEVLANGQWTYTLNNADPVVQALPANQTITDTITVTSADGSDTQLVTVTITGTNDVATISGTSTGTVREDNILTATGTLNVSDLDSGENAVAAIPAGTAGDFGYGTFEVLANGDWTYTLDNAAVQALPAGQTLTDTITVTSADGSDTQVITITIDGDNDPATITGTVTGGVIEDTALTFTGNMSIADADAGEGALVAVAAGTPGGNNHGTFEVLANGQWTYTLNNADPAVQALPAGQTLTDTITVASVDGTDTQVLTVTITGTNDVPTLGGNATGSVVEDADPNTLTVTSALTISDADTGQSNFAVQTGVQGSNGYGSFDMAADGTWTYTADNTLLAIQQLSAGESVTDSFTVSSSDGSASQVVTVTITGTNDGPVANADTGATADGSTVQLDVLANDSDVDHLDVLTVIDAQVVGGGGSVTIASDGSSITFDPGSDFSYLGGGQTADATITYTISDGQGGTATSTVVVTVTGGNEAPVILPATQALASLTELADGNANENNFDHGVSGTIYFADGDAGDTHSASVVEQGAGYLGTFTLGPVNQAGDSLGWSFSVADSALNGLAQGEVVRQYYTVTVSDGQGGQVEQVVEVDLVGTNDRAVLSSANVVVQQGDDPAVASGQLTITDEDDPALFVPQTATAGLYGHLTVNADGSWSYVADQAYTDLAPNAFLTDVFTVVAADSTPTTIAVTIAGIDHPAVGAQDLFTTAENQAFGAGLNLFADNGYGADVDPDGLLQISAVNGQANAVGHRIQLASGALLTVNADGTFSYDPNHAFDSLTAATGAANQFGFDSFTYTLAGGSTTTAFVNIIGVNSAQDLLAGNGHDNAVTGFDSNDTFMLNQGGSDSANGLGGNDGFYFGGYFDSSDAVDGGTGNDTLALQGDTVATLGGVTNVEVITALSGSDTRFGDTANDRYGYDLTTTDATVGAGQTLTVAATGLLAGENLTFDGSAETDGNFRIFAGRGVDDLTGGAGSDGFFFGADGNLTGADHVDGGAGVDTLALRGNYVGGNAVVFQDGSFANVEVLTFLSGHTNEYSGVIVANGYDYDVTMADGNVAAGQRLDVIAGRLGADETLVFNGSAETDGSFRILGGAANDTLTGGAQGDMLYGGEGADRLDGGAGGDVFFYRSASESTSTGYDVITGFDYREDRLDLPGGGARAFSQAGAGSLSTATFDADLSSALDGVLGAGQAALFTANAGTLAGHVFAVVDANGIAGYQAGEDFVIELANPVVPIDPMATVIG